MAELPTPEEVLAAFEAGEIDLETLAVQTLHHIRLLHRIKEIEQIVLNGLLQDVAAISDRLGLPRPSTASRELLQAWLRQVQAAAAELDGGVSNELKS